MKAWISLLLLAGALHANPDGRGWVQVQGWRTVVNEETVFKDWLIQKTDPDTNVVQDLGLGDIFNLRSRQAAEAEIAWPFNKAVTIRGAWRGIENSIQRGIRLHSGSTIDERTQRDGHAGLELGVTLHSGAWRHGAYVPGAGKNPDGWAFWPSLSVGYGLSQAWDERRPVQYMHLRRTAYPLGLDLPLASRLSLFSRYEWVQADLIDAKYAEYYLHPWGPYDGFLEAGLRLFWGQGKPGPWQPRLGPSGAWRLELAYGYFLDAGFTSIWWGRFRGHTTRVALTRALPAGLALSLGHQMRFDPEDPYGDWGTRQMFQHNLGITLRWAWSLLPLPEP